MHNAQLHSAGCLRARVNESLCTGRLEWGHPSTAGEWGCPAGSAGRCVWCRRRLCVWLLTPGVSGPTAFPEKWSQAQAVLRGAACELPAQDRGWPRFPPSREGAGAVSPPPGISRVQTTLGTPADAIGQGSAAGAGNWSVPAAEITAPVKSDGLSLCSSPAYLIARGEGLQGAGTWGAADHGRGPCPAHAGWKRPAELG